MGEQTTRQKDGSPGYKDILVLLDHDKGCKARLQRAVELAITMDAHLVGLYASLAPEPAVTVGLERIVASWEAEARIRTAAMEHLFHELTGAAGIRAEWRCVIGRRAPEFWQQAHYVDLVVAGQEGDRGSLASSTGLVEKLLLEAGRPVLVIPQHGIKAEIGKRIMVAWKANRESARAVNDALPLLQRARQVDVVAINSPPGEAGEGHIPCADICRHLVRHGVQAEARHIVASDLEVGDLLLGRAVDDFADLVVMGAYGHSRLREIILGGATRHMLRHMPIPVFMSH